MKIAWDQLGERIYEIGLDRGVLYRFVEEKYQNGVPWNGLTSMKIGETGSSGFESKLYRRNVLASIQQGYIEYGGTIGCYTYPDEFEEYLGYGEVVSGVYASQQYRPIFGLSFRTLIGNDVECTDYGYKIHLVYNCIAVSDDSTHKTTTQDMSLDELSFDISSYPVESDILDRPSSEIVLDSRKLTKEQIELAESILYGTDDTEPRMPFPDELIQLLNTVSPDHALYPYDDLYPDDEVYPID